SVLRAPASAPRSASWSRNGSSGGTVQTRTPISEESASYFRDRAKWLPWRVVRRAGIFSRTLADVGKRAGCHMVTLRWNGSPAALSLGARTSRCRFYPPEEARAYGHANGAGSEQRGADRRLDVRRGRRGRPTVCLGGDCRVGVLLRRRRQDAGVPEDGGCECLWTHLCVHRTASGGSAGR